MHGLRSSRTSLLLIGAASLRRCRRVCSPWPACVPRDRYNSSSTVVAEPFLAVVSTWPAVLNTQQLLSQVHDVTGLPWWVVIVGSACTVRTLLTLPLAAYQARILGRYAALRPQMELLAQELSIETSVAAKKFGWSKTTANRAFKRSMRRITSELIIEHNCHPFKASIVVLVQIPIWLCLSFALRNLVFMLPVEDFAAQMVQEAMSVEGTLWFPNLTAPDSSLLLPILLGSSNLAVTEVHASRFPNATRFQKGVTYFLYGVSVLMVPMAAFVPSCMALYWTTSSLMGLVHNLVLMSPAFRRFVGISNQSLSERPYRDFLEHLGKKFKRIKQR